MLDWLRRPTPIIEERGPDWFRPARPVPYRGPLGDIGHILTIRHSLITAFVEEDYSTGVGESRLFGRQIVLVNDPAAIRQVMVTNFENFDRKSPQMRRALELLIGDGLFISDGAAWQSRRPLVVDLVHRNRLPAFAASMEAAVADMVTRWTDRPSGVVFDALQDMSELTADTVSRAVFGQKLDPAAANTVVREFTRYQSLIDSVNIGYFLGADDGWPVFRGLRLRRSIQQIHKVIDDTIAGHLEHTSGRSDSDDPLQRAKGFGLDREALRSEAATLFLAGHEGTAATLTWAWYLLANAPWAEQAVHDEIAEVVGGRSPSVADVPALNWCRAVIEETLRLYPSVPILPRQARKPDKLGPVNVEAAALIIVVPWLLHRAVDLWDRPSDFLPERFLGANRPPAFSYIPFAAGPRVCPGMAFGLTEAVLCLATLAQRLKVRIPAGHQVEPHCRLSLRPKGGLPVYLESRQ